MLNNRVPLMVPQQWHRKPAETEHGTVHRFDKTAAWLGAFSNVRLGIGDPGHKDRVTGYVLGNYAKADIEPLSDMLGAVAAEAKWLAEGDDLRFMNDVALRMQP